MINLLDKLDKLELDKKKVFLILSVGLLLIYADFSFFINLQLRSLKTSGPKIIKLKKDIDTLVKDLSAMQNKQTQVKEGTQQLKIIISEDEIPALLQDISRIGNKNNIKIMQIKPSKELRTRQDKTSKEPVKLAPFLITLELSCSYHNFGKFINDLENAKEFMAVQDVKIGHDANDYLRQSVNLVLMTYVKK